MLKFNPKKIGDEDNQLSLVGLYTNSTKVGWDDSHKKSIFPSKIRMNT